ncbi:MAG: hypothetical protein OEW99_05190 [Gammaproteobacteria bacterium]|nr:hypothetical protein [Gammaproteobacteria bacterium]MDH5660551.1 hypothetical protein [Gammaproteobacteria bacterium]
MYEDETNRVKYQVVSVDKIVTPEGMPDGDWYCYVIGYGNSIIDGKKPGTLKNVTQHAEAVAEDLNLRSQNKKSVYAPKQNQNKNTKAISENT